MLGTTENHKLYKEWIAENTPKSITVKKEPVWSEEESKYLTDLDKANKVVVALSSLPNTTFTADQLAATTFESIRRVMQEYQAKHGGYDLEALPEAYLVIPPDFDASQRATIILAARRAGIQVLKLIEEPIAALYGVRRLENFGWYSITDFGDTLKHYVVRVFDGEPDLCEETYVEVPEVLSVAERSFYDHIVARLPATKRIRSWKNELVKIFDAARDYLIDGPEYVIPDSSKWMRSTLPYISREARQLASFYSIRSTEFDVKIANAISNTIGPQQVTHPVLIGGNSLAYPEVATSLEHLYGTRLADTITDPAASLSLGAAMKAAEDLGFTRSILRGRDFSPFGHPILSSNYVDTIHHHLHLSKHHVPLASTLNYSTIAAYGNIEPLLPAFHEEQLRPENVSKPYPAISYAHLRDPFSGDLEHWARVSIQVPRAPPTPPTDEDATIEKEIPIPREFILQDPIPDWLMYEMFLDGEPELADIQPDLSLSFVLNLTASPLYDTSRNVEIDPARPREPVRSADSIARTIPAYAKIMKENPDRPQYRDIAPKEEVPEDLNSHFQENLVDILEIMQDQKDSHSRFYRMQNRAHDLVQSIMSQLRPHDHYSMVAAGGMAQTPLLRSTEIPRQVGSAKLVSGFNIMKAGNHEQNLEKLTKADVTGRASSKYVDAITLAHETFLEHIEVRNSDTSRDLNNDLRDLHKALRDFMGPNFKDPKEEPDVIYGDSLSDLPKGPWSADVEDPAEWNYPGITPGILHDWYQLYQMAQYEVSEKGSKEIDRILKSLPADEIITPAQQRDNWKSMIAEMPVKPYFSDAERREDEAEMFGNFKFLRELLSRMDARKTLKRIFGHQHRMVIITDSIPDADQLKEIESALQRASRDNVSATFISIDGTPFDGPFMQMIARVKGAKAMRFYRKHLWNNEHLESTGTNGWHNAFNEDSVRNLAVKIDFPGYTIDKVYGGWMTPEEKARLEMQKTTSTIRLKIGSLSPSYDIIPGPTPVEGDPIAMLVKLRPKEGHNDAMRATDPDWLYDPASTTSSTALIPGSRIKPSAHTPISFDITWNDRVGTKRNEVTTLRLTDFNSPVGYFDEPGIARLVRNAKFVEFMRKMLHVSIQDKLAVFDSDVPILEVDNHLTGIQPMGQKQENTLVKIYDEARQSVIRLSNERLLQSEDLIPKQYHTIMAAAQHLFELSGIRIQGELTSEPFDPNYDIVSKLLESYMRASNIEPSLHSFAHLKHQMIAKFEAAEVARLEDPNYVPTLASQASQVTLKTLLENNPALDQSLPLPAPIHTPKFHGLLLEPHEKNPVLDRRNSTINAQRLADIEFFPRSEMEPINATSLWAMNTALHGDYTSYTNIFNFIETQHINDTLYSIDERELVKDIVGPSNWPDYERLLDHRDAVRDRARLGLPTLSHDPFAVEETLTPYDPAFIAKMFNPLKDETAWLDLLTTLARKTEKSDRLREKNAILGPALVPISELRRYYNEVVAPHQSPEEIARALKIFKRIEKKHHWSEDRIKRRSALFDSWQSLLEQQRPHPNSTVAYVLSLIEKARQEDIDEATRNHALGQLDSLEQEAIDSNSVLLKHLLENRDALKSVQSLPEGSNDTDIVRELEKHLPEGFLESALSNVTRIAVPDRGVHPSQVDAFRLGGTEEGAFMEEQMAEGYQAGSPPEEIADLTSRRLYSKLLRNVYSRYAPVSESSDPNIRVPLEVHLGNIPIDWEDRFERLKRKARAVVRSRVFREDEEKELAREKFREHVTLTAQRRVDHRLFCLYAISQSSELELSMSDLPYTDQDEYQARLDSIKMNLNPDEYAILVYGEYRRVSQEYMDAFHEYKISMGALIPFMPRTSDKLVDLLEKHNIFTHQKAHQYRDPIGYMFGEEDPRDDFLNVRVDYQEPNFLSDAEHTKREVWETQVTNAQARASAGATDVLVQPDEGGLTVSSGDNAYTDTTSTDASDLATESSDPTTESTTEIPTDSSATEAPADAVEDATAETVEGSETPEGAELTAEGELVEGEVVEEDLTPKEPIYSEWQTITKDPWTKDDFRTDLDYHIYRTQNALEPYTRDPELLAQKKADVNFDILDFLNSDGSIDWAAVKVRRMQYPSLPAPQYVRVVINDAFENTDNLDRELSSTDLDEREITKAEVEAVSAIDIDSEAGLVQSQKTLMAVRLRIAEEERRKEQIRINEAKYEPFNLRNQPLHPLVAASIFSSNITVSSSANADDDAVAAPVASSTAKPGFFGTESSYNPLRDGWDQEKHEEYMARTYDLVRQAQFEAEQERVTTIDRIEQEDQDELRADMIRTSMLLPGAENKTMLEFFMTHEKINREAEYSNQIPDPEELWATDTYSEWLEDDRRLYKGEFGDRWDWLYLKLGSWRIPILPVLGSDHFIHIDVPSLDRLRFIPPSLIDIFEPRRDSMVTLGLKPTPPVPTYVNPKLAKEKRVMDDLSRFALDRYLQAIRKATEKFGLTQTGLDSTRLSMERQELLTDFAQKKALFGRPFRAVAPAETTVVELPIATESERITEAARLTRLSLKLHDDERLAEEAHLSRLGKKPIIAMEVPSRTIESPEDLTSSVPGSSLSGAPKSWRERWESTKQFTMDQMIRDYTLTHESSAFDTWANRAEMEGVTPDSIVKYPVYAPVSDTSSFFGLPNVNVGNVLGPIQESFQGRQSVALETFKKETRAAFRNFKIDQQRVSEAVAELSGPYEQLIRRRKRRMTVPQLDADWMDLLKPDVEAGEKSLFDISVVIDVGLATRVFAEQRVPGADPFFWERKDSKSRRQQKKLNAFLTSGSPSEIDAWEKKMDGIYDRRIKLYEQIYDRKDEIANKRLRNDVHSILGHTLMNDLEETNFFEDDQAFLDGMVVAGVDDLDRRAANPNNKNWIARNYEDRHLEDIAEQAGPDIYTRLAEMVEESLKDKSAAEEAEAGEEFDDPHGHGGHGGH